MHGGSSRRGGHSCGVPGDSPGRFHGTRARAAGRWRKGYRFERRVPAGNAGEPTRPGTRRPTRSQRCWRKPSMVCRNSAASASRARGWWRIRAAIRRRPTWPSGRWSRPAWCDRAAGIVCDAKSGVSGAGRKPRSKPASARSPATSRRIRCSITGTCRRCCTISGLEEREFSFTAQLLPVDRGILETIYFRAERRRQRRGSAGHLRSALCRRAFHPALSRRATCPICTPWRAPISAISGSAVDASTGRAVVVSAIDNLVKGAAGPGGPEHEPDAGVSGDRGPAVKLLVKLGGTLLDAGAHARRRWRAQIAAARAARRANDRGARRRQADDPLSGRARHREPLRQRAAGDHAGDLDAVLKVFAGSVNHELVASLNRAGARAVGLSGIDGGAGGGRTDGPGAGRVGRVTRADPALLDTCWRAAFCRWWRAWPATAKGVSTMSTPIRWRWPARRRSARTN